MDDDAAPRQRLVDAGQSRSAARPPLMRRIRLVPVVAVVVVLALVAAGVASALARRGGGPSGSGAASAAGDPVPPTDGRNRGTTVSELEAFVAKARGLPFKQPVKVTLLSDRDFRARLAAEMAEERTEEDIADTKVLGRVLVALGLLDKGVDVLKAIEALYSASVLGYYDPEADELFVRGMDLDKVSVRSTLVHELTHALQDQHFELHRPGLDKLDDESATGFQGLVEGDAVRVENLYLTTLTLEEQKRGEREQFEQAGGGGSAPPEILVQLVVFPYQVGPSFVAAVFAAGGQRRLDEAFVAPPLTTEHLLHPERFLAGELGAPVTAPPGDGPEVDAGVMGELVLRLLLASELPPSRAAIASTGWGGDRYVAWDSRGRTCVRTAVVADTENDRRELRSALVDWSNERRDARVTDGPDGAIVFTACG